MKITLKIMAILTIVFAVLSFYHIEYTSALTQIFASTGLFLFGWIQFREQKA